MTSPKSLADHITRLSKLESEIITKSSSTINTGDPLFYSDMFAMGAVRRTLSQSKGFRVLINEKNFPCSAAILRMQIDTAMRLNGLSLVPSINEACKFLIEGGKFNKLKSAEGNYLKDYTLKQKLAEEYPWVGSVYEETSDLVHLSMKHLYTSAHPKEEDDGLVHFILGTDDPPHPEEAYFEISEAFFEATKLAGMLSIALLKSTHFQN